VTCSVVGRTYPGRALDGATLVGPTPAGFYPYRSVDATAGDYISPGAAGLTYYGGYGERPYPTTDPSGGTGGGFFFRNYGAVVPSFPLGHGDGGCPVGNPDKVKVFLVGPGTARVWMESASTSDVLVWSVETPDPLDASTDVWTLLSTTAGTYPSTTVEVPDDGICLHVVLVRDYGSLGGALLYGGFDWFPASAGAIGLDVYAIDPPGDSIRYLATLDGAFAKVVRPERNATGSGQFSIRRDDPNATAEVLRQGNLVRVRVPAIDADYIFAFFIESLTTQVVSQDEGGGEVVEVAGRGAMAYFDWARWLAVSYVVPWWDSGWADLVAGEPPAGSLGHVALAAGTYRTFTFNSSGRVVYPAGSITTGGFSAFYDKRQARRWESGAPSAGARVTLVKLSTGAYAGTWVHPSDAGVTDVRASSVLGLRPEFGEIGASDVTQWWDSGWGTPPGGTAGRVAVPAGSFTTYTVSGGKITGKSVGALTTGGFSAWLDQIAALPFLHGSGRGHLLHISSGAYSGTWIHAAAAGLRVWVATEPLLSLVPGKVLWRVCQEAQAAGRPSHPMPLLSYAFTETVDTDGNDWLAGGGLQGVTAEVGDPYLDTLAKLTATGLIDVEMAPSLELRAWAQQGRDLTGDGTGGSVRFEKAANIASALSRERTDGPAATFTQVVGTDGWAQAELPDAADRVTRETSTQAETDDADSLAALGLADLLNRLRRSDAAGFPILVGDGTGYSAGRYLPGPPGSAHGDFWLGDLVTVHTGTGLEDYDEDAVAIAAITLSESEAGDLVVIPEVSSSLGAAEDAAYPGASGSSGGGSSTGSSGSGTTGVLSIDLSGYQETAERGLAGGYAALDGSALVPVPQLPRVELLTTSETDATKVLGADGSGGLAFVTVAGGGGGGADASHPMPLDSYAIDGTYGDDFTGASLSGSWTRRNFTSGAEAYQVGKAATYLRLATTGRSGGDGYFRAAPAGDWTLAMAYIARNYDVANNQVMMLGLACVDTSGNGVVATLGNNTPNAFEILNVSAYTSYGGSYIEAGIPGAAPNVSYLNGAQTAFVKTWLRLRKSGTSYYVAFSLDGEAWGVESGPLSASFTVDRVGIIVPPLASTGTNTYFDVDWFNKIA
jgi:hypothetical protein